VWTCFLLILFNLSLVRSKFDAGGVQTAISRLRPIFGNDIPEGMPEVVAALDDVFLVLHNCIPNIKDGRCYKSRTCRSPKLQYGRRMISFIIKICKSPYQIRVEPRYFKLPYWPWVTVNLRPVIVNFNLHDSDGILTVKSNTNMDAKILSIFRVATARLYIDGILRYDCTKPKHNWRQRVSYNLKAPNRQYTSNFYKLKVRIEVKTRRWKWFRFYWKCKVCKDLVNESGSFGKGPQSCSADMDRYRRDQTRPPLPPPVRDGEHPLRFNIPL